MPKFDITQTNIAVERLLERTDNPRHSYILQNYNRHRYLEMAGRWEEILTPEMTIDHPVYRFNYLGKVFTLDGRDEVASIYSEWAETDQCVFYTEGEELAVSDTMVVSRTTGYQQIPGAILAAEGVPANEDATYLAKSREAMIWPYDGSGKLIGEDVWEFEPEAREFIELAPEDVLTIAQTAELLDPLIKPLPDFEEFVLEAEAAVA